MHCLFNESPELFVFFFKPLFFFNILRKNLKRGMVFRCNYRKYSNSVKVRIYMYIYV